MDWSMYNNSSYHMFRRLWSEISLFHKLIDEIAQEAFW